MRKVLVVALLFVAAALIVAGVAQISGPAGYITAGLCLTALTVVLFADGR